jgi:hypothetical protein
MDLPRRLHQYLPGLFLKTIPTGIGKCLPFRQDQPYQEGIMHVNICKKTVPVNRYALEPVKICFKWYFKMALPYYG